MESSDSFAANRNVSQLRGWCAERLGAEVVTVIFERNHISSVIGVALVDGRHVVVKTRPAMPRLAGCDVVHRSVWSAGFPCPKPLIPPTPLSGEMVSAEAFVVDGEPLQPAGDTPALSAGLLVELVGCTPGPTEVPALDPPPPWILTAAAPGPVWPPADDMNVDLNEHLDVVWIDDLARRVRDRIRPNTLPPTVGHGDWRQTNVRWISRNPHVVYDWDSVIAEPEAVIAGTASLGFVNDGDSVTATLDETEAFLRAYEEARGRPWSTEERSICWAAGLWTFAFNAKKEAVAYGDGPMIRRLLQERASRLARARA